jgi:AraC family transcriptional regulator
MDWLERMNAVIAYIEDNLEGDIDIIKAAEIACCSTYHLQRIFLAVNGLSVAEYIRRRRLTLAARELLSGNAKVIDIALKYGYNSPDSFTRAFRNLHNVTPQAAREPGVQLVAFPRIHFQITLTGGNDMDYKVIDKPAFDIIAKSENITSEIYDNYVIDPGTWEKFWWKYWDSFLKEKRDKALVKMTGGRPGKITGSEFLGVTRVGNSMKDFSYAVGVEKPGGIIPEEYEVIRVPAATWAIFGAKGPVPVSIHDLEDRIFREWFPSTGYEHDSKPELEVYLPGDRESKDYSYQVWMPVVKKDK